MMDLALDGRSALVAGGSKGIGKGVALALAKEGVNVAISARGKEMLEQTAKEIAEVTGSRILPIQADMTRLEDIKRFVTTAADALGGIDILVYSANQPSGGTFDTITDETWRYHIDVKVLGCIRCAREVIPHMKQNRWGRIIIISGMSSRLLRPVNMDNGPVCGALSNFGKQLAHQVIDYGILVNTIQNNLYL